MYWAIKFLISQFSFWDFNDFLSKEDYCQVLQIDEISAISQITRTGSHEQEKTVACQSYHASVPDSKFVPFCNESTR